MSESAVQAEEDVVTSPAAGTRRGWHVVVVMMLLTATEMTAVFPVLPFIALKYKVVPSGESCSAADR